MSERQALGIDINEWSRTGGIDYDLVTRHLQAGVYDFLIIKAGFSEFESPLFREQQQDAERLGIPYLTYHFLVPTQDMRVQIRKYVDWVGSKQPAYILDVEEPNISGSRVPNKKEVLDCVDELVRLTGKKPIIYSRISILEQIGFMSEAEEFSLWIAQYLFDRAHLPSKRLQYAFFHDFVRDYAWTFPPSVKASLQENVILWQFSEKGDGPHYIYSRKTADPRFPIGMHSADLNISIKARDEFMQSFFHETPGPDHGVIRNIPVHPHEPTYPGLTNQDLINLIFRAADNLSDDPWTNWIVRANLEDLAIPSENRAKPYTGPKIEQLPNLTEKEKSAILALITFSVLDEEDEITYPQMTNQDMINLFFRTAAAFTEDPWADWIVRANLEYLAIPDENRTKPYTGAKIEDLPHLTEEEKLLLLANMLPT
jgi:GH25 family lysozyme M1 (1,4-beta-N-acetylmuramidase)